MRTDSGWPEHPHVVVVGAGIAGLAAAWFLRRHDRVDVTVLEGAPCIGGRLRVSEVGGVPVDEGAESMLVRRPEGVDLVRAVGLGDQLVEPGTASASIWVDGSLRPIPSGHVMGVPADLQALRASELLSDDGVAEVEGEALLPACVPTEDVPVGPYVAERLGPEIVDRLVEPLLGGVYAGRADRLSLFATIPQLVPALRETGALVSAARRVRSGAPPASGGPVFQTLRGGLGQLPAAIATRAGVTVRTDAMVRRLRRLEDGWELTVGETRTPELVRADAVVLAVPARPASRLLSDVAPQAAADLAGIDYASMAIVTLGYRRDAFSVPPRGSGFLVPASEGRLVKAATVITNKWPHLDPTDLVLIRCSLGRYGEERRLQRADAELVAVAHAELAEAVGIHADPVETRLTRWGGGLPQYAVGHLDRVAGIRASVATQPGLAVCGAAYDGVGIPACIATARQAADQLLASAVLA